MKVHVYTASGVLSALLLYHLKDTESVYALQNNNISQLYLTKKESDLLSKVLSTALISQTGAARLSSTTCLATNLSALSALTGWKRLLPRYQLLAVMLFRLSAHRSGTTC